MVSTSFALGTPIQTGCWPRLATASSVTMRISRRTDGGNKCERSDAASRGEIMLRMTATFQNIELGNSLLLTFSASEIESPTTIPSDMSSRGDTESKHELIRLATLDTVMFVTLCRKQSETKTAMR